MSRVTTAMQPSTSRQMTHHASLLSNFWAMTATVSGLAFPVAVNRVLSMVSTSGDGSRADMMRIADRRDTTAMGLSSSWSGFTQELRIWMSDDGSDQCDYLNEPSATHSFCHWPGSDCNGETPGPPSRSQRLGPRPLLYLSLGCISDRIWQVSRKRS